VPAPLAAERAERMLDTVERSPTPRRGFQDLALVMVGLCFTLLGMALAAVLVD
jgi:hypothetical protein